MQILSPLLAVSSDPAVTWILLYVGPDLILPLTSALAAVAGVLLMFWQRVMGVVRSVWTTVFPRNK